jgi:membrane-associated phospholipid phosphatase
MPRWLIYPSVHFGTCCLGTRVNVAALVTVTAVAMSGLAPAPARAQTAPPPLSGFILPEEPLFPVLPRDEREPKAGPSFPDLFRSVGNDFKSFPNRQNVLWLFVGGGLSGLSHSADDGLTAQLSTSGAVSGLKPGRVIGGSLAQVGGAFATYGIGRLTKSPTVTAVGADLVRAQVLTQGITQAIKFTAGRTRPDGTVRSFPSGHTASAFATGTVLQRHFGWKVGIPAYGLATYVAASRLSENRHYLSDVIFGATVGVLAGRQVTVRFGKTRFALTPQAVPGGAGIALVKIGR